ncbi:MAG TPA: hypothetical protein VFA51_12695 [Candidatus Udaeobacter sp.]|nr:hypothetical protein [Candidatus Udaeobacter sp.]
MNSFTVLREHLSDPEYIHVLINPLPVYGLAIAIIALVLSMFLRNQRLTIAALILTFVTAISAWPTYHYGEAAYDRVKAMSDPAGEQWLDEHMARGEKMIWLFYVLAGVAAIGVGAVLKWPRTSFAITVGTLVLGAATLGTGGYIAYAGGHIRHKEFRFEPPPAPRAEEHHHGEEHQHGAEQKPQASPVGQAEHAGHEGMQPQQSPSAEAPKTEEERKQLEASRLQLEASRLQLEASKKQLEAAGGASPSASPGASPSGSPGEKPSPEEQHQHEHHPPP